MGVDIKQVQQGQKGGNIMIMKNKIFTIEEYMEQGFTKIEAYVVRKTDKMFNNFDNLTEEEKRRYFLMCERLGL